MSEAVSSDAVAALMNGTTLIYPSRGLPPIAATVIVDIIKAITPEARPERDDRLDLVAIAPYPKESAKNEAGYDRRWPSTSSRLALASLSISLRTLPRRKNRIVIIAVMSSSELERLSLGRLVGCGSSRRFGSGFVRR